MLTMYIRCCIVIYMRRRKEMKRLVSYRFEEELIKRLDQLSKRTYIPKSKLVELALDEFITKKEKEMQLLSILFVTIAGILLMLTVTGIIGPVTLIAIYTGIIIGGVLIAPQWAARRHLK